MQQQQGTKHIGYQKVSEQEGGGTGSSRTTVHFCSILALPQFRDANEKSPLELRWEDYQVWMTALYEQGMCRFAY